MPPSIALNGVDCSVYDTEDLAKPGDERHLPVVNLWHGGVMNDDAQIRRENLRSLRLPAKELSRLVGGRDSYWRGVLDGSRSFGEKAARKIEEKMGLPRGRLDQPTSVAEAETGANVSRLIPPQVQRREVPGSGVVAADHWQTVAREVARQLGDQPVNAERFLDVVDLMAAAIPAHAPEREISSITQRHLRLVK